MQDWKSLPDGLREICDIDSLSSFGIPAKENQKNAEGFIWRVEHTSISENEIDIKNTSIDCNKFNDWLVELTAKSNYAQKNMGRDQYKTWVSSCKNKAVQYILYLAANDIKSANALYSEYLTAMKYALVQDAEAFDDRKCHIVKNIFNFEKPQNVLSLGNIWMASEMPYDNFFGYVQPKVQISLDNKRDFSDDLAKRTRFNDLEKGVYYRLIQYYYGLFSENLNLNERAIILLYALRSNPNLSWAYLEIFEHFPEDADEYEKLAKKYVPTLTKKYFEERQEVKKYIADVDSLESAKSIDDILTWLDDYKKQNRSYDPVNEIKNVEQLMQKTLAKEVNVCNSIQDIPDLQTGTLAVKYKKFLVDEIGEEDYNKFIGLLNQKKTEQILQEKLDNIQISYQRAKEYIAKINASEDLDVEKICKKLKSESVYLLAAHETKKSTKDGYSYDLILNVLNGTAVPIESPAYQKLLSTFFDPKDFLVEYDNIAESSLLGQIATWKQPKVEPEEPPKEIKRVSEKCKIVSSIIAGFVASLLLLVFIPKGFVLVPFTIILALSSDKAKNSLIDTIKILSIGLYVIGIPVIAFLDMKWLISKQPSWILLLLLSFVILLVAGESMQHGVFNIGSSFVWCMIGGTCLSAAFFMIAYKLCTFIHLAGIATPAAIIAFAIIYIVSVISFMQELTK